MTVIHTVQRATLQWHATKQQVNVNAYQTLSENNVTCVPRTISAYILAPAVNRVPVMWSVPTMVRQCAIATVVNATAWTREVAAHALIVRMTTGAIQLLSAIDVSARHMDRCPVSATRIMDRACVRRELLVITVIDVIVVPLVTSRTVHRVASALTTGLEY